MDDLRFIRQTMERAGSFTAVPGWGGVAMGLTALIAAWIASQQATPARWLIVWLAAAAVASVIAVCTLTLKAKRSRIPLSSGPGRKFLLAFLPTIGAAAALTFAIYLRDGVALLPALWILLYGAAMIAAGAYSVRIVPLMGIVFLFIGSIALVTPTEWGNAWMAVAFGVVFILFGFVIARRHGG